MINRMRNEKTGKQIAGIAGRLLGELDKNNAPRDGKVYIEVEEDNLFCLTISVFELRSLAASALTQAADKPIKKRG